MGTRRDPTLGLGLVYPAVLPDAETSQGTGTLDTAYTQAGPHPGHPVPGDPTTRWRPFLSQAQSVDLQLRTLSGGFPGRYDDAAGVGYRPSTETADTDWRGWAHYDVVTAWSAPSQWRSAAWRLSTATVRPGGREVIVTSVSSGNPTRTWSFVPRTQTWTSRYNWQSSGPTITAPLASAYDPDTGRLLMWTGAGGAGEYTTIAYYSEDHGLTWKVYTRGMYPTTVAATGSGSVAVSPDQDWAAVIDGEQYASSDRGVTWDLVESNIDGAEHQVVRTSAGFVLAYLRSSDDALCVRVLPTARVAFTDATEVVVLSNAGVTGTVVVDGDGAVHAFVQDTGVFQRSTSVDGGVTWTDATVYLAGSLFGAIAYGRYHTTVAVDGALWAVGHRVGATADIHALRVGGWGTVEPGYYAVGATRRRWGYGGISGAEGNFYAPWDTPALMQWTTTSTGTIDTSPTVPSLELTTTAGQLSSHSKILWSAGSALDYVCGEACLTVPSGPNASSGGVFVAQGCQDGAATGVSGRIYFGPDGFEVRDGASTVRATVAVDMTDDDAPVHVRWQIRSATPRMSVWYKAGHGTRWTLAADEVTLTSGALGTSATTFGNPSGSASPTVSRWRFVGAVPLGDWRSGIDGIADAANDPTDGPLGLAFGRPVPGVAQGGVAVSDGTASTEDEALITAAGGPTYTGELVSLPTGYTYPATAIYPQVSPSPRRTWQATGTAQVQWTWDLGSGESRWLGGGIGLLVLGGDFREIELATVDQAGTVTGLLTLDKGWDVLYTIVGRAVAPRSGTTTIDRYLHEGELVGGYMVCDTAGSSVARRIVYSSAGYWTTDGTVQQVRIELEGVDGSETVNGTGEIVSPRGLAYSYPDTIARRIRVRILSGATVPEGRYAAGIIAPMRIVGVGAEAGWDWSERFELQREVSRRPDGRSLVRQLGPPIRSRSYSWAGGLMLQELRTLAIGPGYVAASGGGGPIGTYQDAWTVLHGLAEHWVRSGELPGVLIPRLRATQLGASLVPTVTDPEQILYGLLSTDRLDTSGVSGTEGVDEVVRVLGLSWEEIR